MKTLLPEDLNQVIRCLPKDVFDALKSRPGRYLAGGFIRSIIAHEEVNDIDLFAYNKPEASFMASTIADGRDVRPFFSKNAITIAQPTKTTVQVITRWTFEDPHLLQASFDFSIARAVIWCEAGVWKSACDDCFYPDLASKRLRYLAPERDEEAGGSFLRMQKFLRRGYSISPEESARVIERLISPVQFEDLKRENSRVSVSKVIAGLLREVDPNNVVDGVAFDHDEGEDIPEI